VSSLLLGLIFIIAGVIIFMMMFSNNILQFASKHGYKNLAKIILDLGAKVHYKNNRAIELASINGHAEIVKILLEHDADPSVNNNYPLKISSTKLLKDYKELKRSFDIVSKKNEQLIKDKEKLIKTNIEVSHKIEKNDTLESHIKKLKKQIVELIDCNVYLEEHINDILFEKLNKEISEEPPAKYVGDLNDYEYQNDGKRMCFINIHTGNKVYYHDPLFDELKRRMLRNS
jgi:hypothetical protein